jgi:transglutaminase/protease-like cytokinesis protein 3
MLSFSVCAQIEDFEHISFYKADRIAESFHGADLKDVPRLTQSLTQELDTDVEKLRSIFMWITHNISSDSGIFERNKRKRKQFKNDSVKLIEWNHHIRRKTITRLLKKKKTVCTGYAYLLKEMCKYAGITSKIVNGFSRTAETESQDVKEPNHSWNVVLLNGKWYLCDPTWATGIFDPNSFKFDFEYQEGFFLGKPELFIKNHYPLDLQWTLLGEQTPSFEEFLEGPLFYNAAFNYGIMYQGSLKMNNTISKKETVSFQFDQLNPKEIESVHLVLSGLRNDIRKTPQDLVIDKDSIHFNYQFLHKGHFDLHLMLNDEAIMTYTFHVKK